MVIEEVPIVQTLYKAVKMYITIHSWTYSSPLNLPGTTSGMNALHCIYTVV